MTARTDWLLAGVPGLCATCRGAVDVDLAAIFGACVDPVRALQHGLEAAMLDGEIFDHLFSLVAGQMPVEGLPECEQQLPPDPLTQRIIARGFHGLRPDILIRLISNPERLAGVWDALNCLPPFWVEATGWLDQRDEIVPLPTTLPGFAGLGSDENQARHALTFVSGHYTPPLWRFFAGRASPPTARQVLTETWTEIWRHRDRWAVSQTPHDDLLDLARDLFVEYTRPDAPASPGVAQPVREQSHPTTSAQATAADTGDVPLEDEEVKVFRDFLGSPKVGATDRDILFAYAACGTAGIDPHLCRRIGLSPEDARKRLGSLLACLAHEISVSLGLSREEANRWASPIRCAQSWPTFREASHALRQQGLSPRRRKTTT